MDRSKKTALLLAAVIVLLGSLAVYYYNQANKLKNNSQGAGTEETEALIKRVSRLIILPSDEQPTIATITDTEQLKGQAFFANAQIGDKVIIYTNAKKAILFRPSENKIVEVAPLNLEAPAS